MTEKPRFSITLDDEILNAVEEYRHENRIDTRSHAIAELMERGMESLAFDAETRRTAQIQENIANGVDKMIAEAVAGASDAEIAEIADIISCYRSLPASGRARVKNCLAFENAQRKLHTSASSRRVDESDGAIA